MSIHARLSALVLLSFVALLFLVRPAAACNPLPDVRYVGNTATDSKCTDNDIQSAINNVTCPNTTIYITNEHTYTAQHLTIGRSMTLVGLASGIVCDPPPQICADPPCVVPPEPQVTLDGTGQTGAAVISITGNASVTLKYLEITGANEGSGNHGGGIDFDGYGTLNLDFDTINANTAGYGAGVYVNGDGGNAVVNANDYTLIEGNTALNSGGGIMAEGTSRVFVMGNPAFVGINHAPNGYGGGIYVTDPARADIGSPGYVNLGVIYDNDAAYGGGIAAVTHDDNGQNAVVRLFTTDPEHPVAVQSNRATVEGGGFYLKPTDGFLNSSGAWACVYDSRIIGNSAPEGTAAYADFDTQIGTNDTGSVFSLNPAAQEANLLDDSICGLEESAASLGAVACAADAPCNEVSANTGVDNNNQPSGSILYSGNNSDIELYQATMRSNSAMHGFNAAASDQLTLQTCLMADNTFAQQAILATGGTPVVINSCTLVNDIIDATHVIKIDSTSTLTMLDDIVDEAGTLTLDQPGSLSGNSNLNVSYVLSNDATTLPSSSNIVQGDPLFVNVASANYHLQAYVQNGVVTASPAIDFALPITGDDRDLDGLPFDQDVPQVANRFGVRDLGAYEMQPIVDRIFTDGFGDPISIVY